MTDFAIQNRHLIEASYLGAVSAASVELQPYTLTGQDLLDFCRAKMNAIDNDIAVAMRSQEDKGKTRNELSSFQNAVNRFSPGGPQNENDWQSVKQAYDKMLATLGPDDPTVRECGEILKGLEQSCHRGAPPNVVRAQQKVWDLEPGIQAEIAALDRSPNNDTARRALEEKQTAMRAAQQELAEAQANPDPGEFTKFGAGEWSSQAVTTLDTVMTKLKTGAEMEMIRLQSMVSQRQVVIQLVTGMMAKLDQSQETIARNIGGG